MTPADPPDADSGPNPVAADAERNESVKLGSVTSLARAAFVVYALALLIATHWPGMQVQGPVARTDLWIHVFAYAGLAGLLVATGWCGRPGVRTALVVWGIASAFGAFDELTQPLFNRTGVFDDWVADVIGGAVGAALATIAMAALARRAA